MQRHFFSQRSLKHILLYIDKTDTLYTLHYNIKSIICV